MRKRIFLAMLILFLLLTTMANQHVQNAAALLGGNTVLGCIPLGQLYNVLPAGIFAAGVCATALGMGAEFWGALLPLCGAKWAPKAALSRLADAGLWCGWVTLAACITALGCVFPWSVGAPGAYGPGLSSTTFFDVENYQLVLQICGGIMILCRILAVWLKEHAALPIVILVSAAALVCGQFWCQAHPISYLGIALLLPWAVLQLWIPGRMSPQQFYTTLTAIAIAIYGQAFSHTIGSYVIDANPHDGSQVLINALILLGCLLLHLGLRPFGLLRRPRLQRSLGGLVLLCCLYPIWHLVAAGVAGQAIRYSLPLSIGCYIVPLLCVSALTALRLWGTAPQKTEKN